MFGRQKSEQPTAIHEERPGAKNRPTPKRRDQEAARRQPLVVTDRKAARAKEKDVRREALAKQRQAMLTGDERHMPARDAGPVRRYIRDYVDARRNLGEIMLPIMVLMLAVSLLRVVWAFYLVTFGIYFILIVAIVDAILMWRRLKKLLIAKFGASELPRGAASYTMTRVFQMRMLRMPKPQVGRGQYPS